VLHLRTFGGLAIDRGGGPLAVGGEVRRRHLALLALLASRPEQGMSRDKVIAYLWPESDIARARNNLKQTLFSLRQVLGPAVPPSRESVLRVDPYALQVDLWEFESALARGDHAGAAAAYTGPYLDGFYIEGLAEFERWVEAERLRLAESNARALRCLAQQADDSHDHASAVNWWRRLALVEPFSSSSAIGLMQALAAAGDRVAALEYAGRHAALLGEELNLAPDEHVIALALELRSELARRPAPSLAPGWAPPPSRTSYGRRDRRAVSLAVPRPAPVPARVRVQASYLAMIGLLLAVVWAGLVARREAAVPSAKADPAAVVVLPFTVSGDPKAQEFVTGVEDLLATNLDGADGLRSVPLDIRSRRAVDRSAAGLPENASALAGRARARLYVTGHLVAQGDRLRATALLHDRGNVNIPVGRADVESESVFDLVEQLAKQLIAEQYRGADQRLVRTAAMSTRSLLALKAYLHGDRLLHAGRYAAAADAFKLAVRADTSFALGYHRLSVSANLGGEPDLALHAAEQASRFGALLSDHDRGLVEAYGAYRRGRLTDAERIYRRIVTDYSEDVDAWLGLGEVLFHGNPLQGRSSGQARASFERVIALDPSNARALVYLARIAWVDGDRRGADSLIRRVVAITPEAAAVDLHATLALFLPDRAGHLHAAPSGPPVTGRAAAVAALQGAVYLDDLPRAERLARWLAADSDDCAGMLGHRMLAQTSLARGALHAAEAHLASIQSCDASAAIDLSLLLAALPFVPADAREVGELRRSLGRASAQGGAQPKELQRRLRVYGLGLLAFRQGDTLQGRRWERRLVALIDSTRAGELAVSLAASLRARAALADGRKAAALAALDGARWERAAMLSITEVSDRYLRAALLQELGREEDAIGWYKSIAERALYETVYLAPAQYQLARIYERRGERAEAASRYRRFVELWKDCDPELRPRVVEATQRLAALAAD
jgi:DNA-binding SARP family transcriptional activator/Tfp pilus assembly protein PilF